MQATSRINSVACVVLSPHPHSYEHNASDVIYATRLSFERLGRWDLLGRVHCVRRSVLA